LTSEQEGIWRLQGVLGFSMPYSYEKGKHCREGTGGYATKNGCNPFTSGTQTTPHYHTHSGDFHHITSLRTRETPEHKRIIRKIEKKNPTRNTERICTV